MRPKTRSAKILRRAIRAAALGTDPGDLSGAENPEAIDRIRDLRDPGAVAGWLIQIALRLVHRRFRRRKLLRVLGLDCGADDATLESQAEPGLRTEARVELLMLEGVLRNVPVAHRVAWMLRHVEGYSLAEVASACSCSLATAKRRIGATEAKVRCHVDLKKVVS